MDDELAELQIPASTWRMVQIEAERAGVEPGVWLAQAISERAARLAEADESVCH